MTTKFCPVWRSFFNLNKTYCNGVRQKSSKYYKQAQKVQQQHHEFLNRESAEMFGPNRLRNRNVALKGLKSMGKNDVEEDKVPKRSRAKVLSGQQDDRKVLISTEHGMAVGENTIIDATPQRTTRNRELDLILTYPFWKQADSSDMSLVPSVSASAEIPILNSNEVNSLDRKSAMPSVSYVLEKSRSPEEQAVLDRWKEKMISELGEEGFELFQKGKNPMPFPVIRL